MKALVLIGLVLAACSGYPQDTVCTPVCESLSGSVKSFALTNGYLLVSFDYRLAPEDPYPAGLDDTVAAYEWLISTGGVHPSRIVVPGDSAVNGFRLVSRLDDLVGGVQGTLLASFLGGLL